MTEPKHIIFKFNQEPSRVTHQSGLRYSKFGSYKTKALRAWELQLEQFFRSATYHIHPDEDYFPFEGPIELEVEFSFKAGKKKDYDTWKVTRPDLDNMAKTIKDVMTTTGIWIDDSQVVKEHTSKQWRKDPGIVIKVRQISNKATEAES